MSRTMFLIATDDLVRLDGVECRVWRGTLDVEGAIGQVIAYVHRVAVDDRETVLVAEAGASLQEMPAPKAVTT